MFGINAVHFVFTFAGLLVNSVIVEIMKAVSSLEDISSDDAIELHSLMSLFINKCPQWFEAASGSGVVPTVHQAVRKWNKLREFLFVLNASLQEIGERWASGQGPLAAECSAAEVKQLIRALFQNTDRRAAVLAKIV